MPKPIFTRGPKKQADGTTSDLLVRAFLLDDRDVLNMILEEIISSGSENVLNAAIGGIQLEISDDGIEEFLTKALSIAEELILPDGTYATLRAIVTIPPETGETPAADVVTRGLADSGAFGQNAIISIVPGWRSLKTLLGLTPFELRRVLLDLIKDKPATQLAAAADSNDLCLVALCRYPSYPYRDEKSKETIEEKITAEFEAFLRWRTAKESESPDFPHLYPPVPPSEILDQLKDNLDDQESEEFELKPEDEIIDFIEVARKEAGEEIICHYRLSDTGLQLDLKTKSGRTIDTRTIREADLPLPVDAILDRIRTIVPVEEKPQLTAPVEPQKISEPTLPPRRRPTLHLVRSLRRTPTKKD